MPSEPSRTDVTDGDVMDGDEMDGVGSAGAGAVSATAGSSSVTDSRNVADGTKNRLPVTARLKSSSRS